MYGNTTGGVSSLPGTGLGGHAQMIGSFATVSMVLLLAVAAALVVGYAMQRARSIQ